MSKDKHAKAMKRRQKVAEDAKRREAVKAIREFPEILMVPNEAPASFVATVREACRAIDFADPKLFLPWETNHYRRIKQFGVENIRIEIHFSKQEAQKDAFDFQQKGMLAQLHFTNNLGDQVFSRIPKAVLLKHVPYNDVFFVPKGNQIQAVFRSLKRAKGSGGTIYYSPHKPKVLIDGKSFTVGFSDHAIERMCERLCHAWPSYGMLGDLYALFDQCLDFHQCNLFRGADVAFTFFDNCFPMSWRIRIAEAIFGEGFDQKQDYCYRVGYCPVVFEGEFAKAKTMYFPGFRGTPEHDAIHAARIPWNDKLAMLRIAEALDVKFILDAEVAGILKWFQVNGVVQVEKRRAEYIEDINQMLAFKK